MKVTLESILPDMRMFLNVDAFEREAADALDHAINIVHDDFQATIKTWRTQPKFEKRYAKKIGGRLEARTSTNDTIYFYVEKGTRPHLILPRQSSVLSFRTRYRAKTRVRVVGSRAGGARGPRVMAKRVLHPGFPGREFSPTIAKRRQKNLTNLVRVAIMRSFRYGGVH